MVGPISWQGNCRPCGQAILAENIRGIAAKRGPAYRRQLRGMVHALARSLDEAGMTP